jgi:hypothetical protein
MKENNADDEDKKSSSHDNEESIWLQELSIIARIEDQVDMMIILLTIQTREKKIVHLMKKHNILKEREGVLVSSRMRRPKNTPVSRGNSSVNEKVLQMLNILPNDGAMVCTLTSSLPNYNGRGKPQKVYKFIQKHDDFFMVADLTPYLGLVLALAKLSGSVYL